MAYFLSDSERSHLKALLQERAGMYGLDERHIESDYHLAFEGLHILADGMPERLYALLHARSQTDHPDSSPGQTMLIMQRIAEHGSRAEA